MSNHGARRTTLASRRPRARPGAGGPAAAAAPPQLVAIDLSVAGSEKARFRHLKSSHYPDLRGSMQYIDSPRQASYVETHTDQHVLAEIREAFGWPAVDNAYFEALPAGLEPVLAGR